MCVRNHSKMTGIGCGYDPVRSMCGRQNSRSSNDDVLGERVTERAAPQRWMKMWCGRRHRKDWCVGCGAEGRLPGFCFSCPKGNCTSTPISKTKGGEGASGQGQTSAGEMRKTSANRNFPPWSQSAGFLCTPLFCQTTTLLQGDGGAPRNLGGLCIDSRPPFSIKFHNL